MKLRPSFAGCAGLLLPVAAAFAAEPAAPARPFAAPEVTSGTPTGAVGGIAQVTFALLVVLVAVFVVAVLVRRFHNLAGGGSGGIEVLAQTALGQRERAVIVRVGEARLLLGVTPGQVTLLHTLPADAQLPGVSSGPESGRPTFAGLLKKSLGR
ncbi:MAG: flagellar biosynthetic protein FliO [Steroidobacteraceae bacterium]